MQTLGELGSRIGIRVAHATFLRESISSVCQAPKVHPAEWNSHNYTYTFDPKCDWSSTYSSSREIFQYFSGFVDKHELREYIASHHEVTGARWDEKASEWVVQVQKHETGSTFERRCDFLINACGVLNSWRWPTIPGIQSFKGPLLHTAAWEDNVDLTGKNVGLIGNGYAYFPNTLCMYANHSSSSESKSSPRSRKLPNM